MTYNLKIDELNKLIIFSAIDYCNLDELKVAHKEIIELSNKTGIKKLLADYSKSILPDNINDNFVDARLNSIKETPENMRIAIIPCSCLIDELIDVSEAEYKKKNTKMKVFKDRDSAIKWLKEV